MLATARNGGTLVNASSLANFGATTGFVNGTSNTPFLAPTAVGTGRYQVFLTNDRAEGSTNATDANSALMLTALGSGPNGVGFAAVQAEVAMSLPDLPELPGVVTLPGPTIDFEGFNSNSHDMNGDDNQTSGCRATIAVTSTAAELAVDAEIADRASGYSACDPSGGGTLSGTSTSENFLENAVFAPSNPYEPTEPNTTSLTTGVPDVQRLIRIDYLTSLVASVREVADFTSASDAGFTLGTTSDPKVVVIDGDFSTGSAGAGVLVVTGTLTFTGSMSYSGLVLVIGEGSVRVTGGGDGTFLGSMLVADTVHSYLNQGIYVGEPSYRDSGGGNATQRYDAIAAKAEDARGGLPLERTSYQQLR
jgi:hypothetical protein